MKLCYLLSHYISHFKAGMGYQKCLNLIGIEIVNDPQDADLVILHDEPTTYPHYFKKYPGLSKKPVIAVVMWETPILPRRYIENLSFAHEIWTGSEFSLRAFRDANLPAYKIPHVVERYTPPPEKIDQIKERIRHNDQCFYFYTIIDATNPRKNIQALITAFTRLFPNESPHTKLVIKQYRKSFPNLKRLPNILTIDEMLDEEAIEGLHTICDCYVGTHRSEAWGLGYSEAMAFGNAVIATGYSGNMDYMTHDNAFPVDFTLRPLTVEEITFDPTILSTDMIWAEINIDDLMDKMTLCRQPEHTYRHRQNAIQILNRFSVDKVSRLIAERLQNFGAHSYRTVSKKLESGGC